MPLDHGARIATCLHVRRVAGAAIETAVSYPHSLHGSPSSCSQCRTDTPRVRRVEQQADVLVIDGEVVRSVEAPPGDYYPKRKARR